MPRNSGGTMSAANGPYVTNTTINSTQVNARLSDEENEIGDSLCRSGKGSMLAPLSLNAGASVAAPDLTWTGDSDTGLYRSAANSVALACAGTKILEVTATVFSAFADVLLGSAKVILDTANSILKQTASNSSLTLQGNRSAADTGDDVIVNSAATRTAGNLLNVKSNGTSKLTVDFSGQLKWPSGPASTATSPAPSAVTALTLQAGWTSTGAAYWKGPDNIVHLRGNAANNTGGSASLIVSATPLPAGFRPSITRAFTCTNTSADLILIQVTSGGVISAGPIANTHDVWLDGLNFLADA